jgi:hypothetical protein
MLYSNTASHGVAQGSACVAKHNLCCCKHPAAAQLCMHINIAVHVMYCQLLDSLATITMQAAAGIDEALYDINDVGMRQCVVAAVAVNAAAAMLPHLQH